MRILVLTWEFTPYIVGGMGQHAADLTPMLGGITTQFGNQQVDVVTTRFAGGDAVEQLNDYVTVHRADVLPVDPTDFYNSVIAGNDSLIECARSLAEQNHYDLIHVHDWLPGVAGLTLKHEWKIPLVVTIHATERGRHQGHIPSSTSHQIDSLEAQLCHESWKVIVCSRFMTTELHHFFGTPFDKIAVIPNGINLNTMAYATSEEQAALRVEYAPNGERLLFFVGRIVHEKGVQVLIEALPMILSEFPNTRLLVAGKNSRKMWPLARELRVDQAVHFLDYISDKRRDHLYQIVDAAIFPSLYEPFGIVALEAMALGCNVIASDVGGLGEVVQHMQNGITVYPHNPQSIAWAVGELFADPNSAKQRRERAIYQVRHYYSWREIAEQTTRLFEQVLVEYQKVEW